jgi:hypothetical protein
MPPVDGIPLLKLADNLPHPQKPTMHAVNSVSASARMYPPPFLLLGPALKAAPSSVQLFIFSIKQKTKTIAAQYYQAMKVAMCVPYVQHAM